MKKLKNIALDFEIDRLTNSIQNTISGDSFPTDVSRLTKADLKEITKKNGWSFNWKSEFEDNTREVYKLTITNNQNIIQGLLSFTIQPDTSTYIYWKVRHSISERTNYMKVFNSMDS